MEDNSKENQDNDSIEKDKPEPFGVNLKFIEVVDYIIGKNKPAKVKPYTDNALSQALFGDRTIIGKVRTYGRSITIAQLREFGVHFKLDFNFFFRNADSMFYKPQAAHRSQTVTGKQAITGKNIDIINEMNHSTLHKGDVNYGGVGKIIEKVDKVTENTLNNPQSMELQTLEATSQQNEDIKEIVEYYEAQLSETQKQLDKAREEKYDISKKYINLLEQKINT